MLEISTGATTSNQGQYAYAVSGINPDQVYDVATKLLGEMLQHDGPAVRQPSPRDCSTTRPNLDIDILRDQASIYGVSATRILSLLRSAYSQNYALPDQEARGPIPGDPRGRGLRPLAYAEDLSLLYIAVRRRRATWSRSSRRSSGTPRSARRPSIISTSSPA